MICGHFPLAYSREDAYAAVKRYSIQVGVSRTHVPRKGLCSTDACICCVTWGCYFVLSNPRKVSLHGAFTAMVSTPTCPCAYLVFHAVLFPTQIIRKFKSHFSRLCLKHTTRQRGGNPRATKRVTFATLFGAGPQVDRAYYSGVCSSD